MFFHTFKDTHRLYENFAENDHTGEEEKGGDRKPLEIVKSERGQSAWRVQNDNLTHRGFTRPDIG